MKRRRLDAEEVRRIARLARLGLTGAEVERMRRDLATVLGHFEAIEAAGDGAPDAIHDRELDPALREDAPPSDPLLRSPDLLAPDWRDGFFLVPSPPALEGAGDGHPQPGEEGRP